MKAKLALDPHLHYPESWLNIASAQVRCALQNVPFRATLTFCRQNGIEVSSTGHIRLIALEQYIKWAQAS